MTSGLWITPVVEPSRWWLFAALLLLGTCMAYVFSPHRRRAMGRVKFFVANATRSTVPLLGVIVVRSGFRHAYLEDGRGWWAAMWLSLMWMSLFVAVGQFLVRMVPPTSWLLASLRRCEKDMWKGRLQRWFGLCPARARRYADRLESVR